MSSSDRAVGSYYFPGFLASLDLKFSIRMVCDFRSNDDVEAHGERFFGMSWVLEEVKKILSWDTGAFVIFLS